MSKNSHCGFNQIKLSNHVGACFQSHLVICGAEKNKMFQDLETVSFIHLLVENVLQNEPMIIFMCGSSLTSESKSHCDGMK